MGTRNWGALELTHPEPERLRSSGMEGGGAMLFKCLAKKSLNSKRTANTISGTDSSHLVQKLVTKSRN